MPPSLELRPFTPRDLLALVEGESELSLGARAAAGLRSFFVSEDVSPEWLDGLRDAGEPDPWRDGFAMVHLADGLAIGTVGFKGPPGEGRFVELAYAVVPSHRGRGHATEAAVAATRFALDDDRIDLVVAHTLAVPSASTRVLGKAGFDQVGEFEDPDDGPVWRWECSAAPPSRGTVVADR